MLSMLDIKKPLEKEAFFCSEEGLAHRHAEVRLQLVILVLLGVALHS